MLEKSPDDKIREVFEERFQHYSTSDIETSDVIKERLFKWFVIGFAECYKEMYK